MEAKLIESLQSHWDDLFKAGQELRFSKGQVLYYEGHSPYGLFVIRKGKVQFTKDKRPCRCSHAWQSAKGDVLGVETLLSGKPYSCTGTATQNCQVVFISKTQLLPFLGAHTHS